MQSKNLRVNNYIVQVLHVMEDYRNEVCCSLCKHNLSTFQVTNTEQLIKTDLRGD